jgi:hypothetical protein
MWWHGLVTTPWGYALTTVGMMLFLQLAVFGMIVMVRYLGYPNQSVAERPVPRNCLPSRYTDSINTGCEDRSRPATTLQPGTLRSVSPV